jgi:hypothetical protein
MKKVIILLVLLVVFLIASIWSGILLVNFSIPTTPRWMSWLFGISIFGVVILGGWTATAFEDFLLGDAYNSDYYKYDQCL